MTCVVKPKLSSSPHLYPLHHHHWRKRCRLCRRKWRWRAQLTWDVQLARIITYARNHLCLLFISCLFVFICAHNCHASSRCTYARNHLCLFTNIFIFSYLISIHIVIIIIVIVSSVRIKGMKINRVKSIPPTSAE